MRIKGINHITFAVADLESSVRFYTQVLGASLLLRGARTAYMDLAGVWVALNLDPGRPKAPEVYSHIAFTVDEADLDLFLLRLQDWGAKLQADRPRHPMEGVSLYFKDPDGHLLELHTKTVADRVDYYRQTRKDMKFYDGGK